MNEKFYRVVCSPINLIILVKKLSLEEEKRIYLSTKRKIAKLKEPITIDSYQRFIIKTLLQSPTTFFDKIELEEGTSEENILGAVYDSITQIYPALDLNMVCGDLNQGVFFGDLQDVLSSFLDEQLKDSEVSLTSPLPSMIKNPSNISSLDDIIKLKSFLKRRLIGQDKAIDIVIDHMKLVATNLSSYSSLFFIGPTGVGKTELARLLGRRFSGNFFKINCAEYASQHEYSKLIGSPPGYVGHSDKSLLAEKAEKSNRWVFLFDEVEKAHSKFFDFLLSMLDEGTVTDNMGKTLDFSESIFIFTSNQGVSDLDNAGNKLGFGDNSLSDKEMKNFLKGSLKKAFSPEFMNRIDSFVYFNSLSRDDVKKIASLSLTGIPVKKLKCLVDYIVANSFSEEYGARNIKRFIKNNVAVSVADKILSKMVPAKRGQLYTPKIVGGKLHIVDTIPYEGQKVDSVASGI